MSARNYITVEGPVELREALVKRAKDHSQLAAQPYYILYTLANQASLLRIDPPFIISHYDLLGRPATVGVKEVINCFLREECAGQGHFEDVSGKELVARNIASFLKSDSEKGRVVLSTEAMTVAHAQRRLEEIAKMPRSVVEARGQFRLFPQPEVEQLSQGAAVKLLSGRISNPIK